MLYLRRTAACSLVFIALLTLAVAAQGPHSHEPSDDQGGSGSLQGYVRDWHGRAIISAIVYLRMKPETQTLTVRTDADGAYRFSGLREGVYALRAVMAGYDEITSDPCVLGAKEKKRVDLTLVSTAHAAAPSASVAEKPEFFDEPKFTVAGVTEAMNPGGHGSDTTMHTTDSLAKQTASLSAPTTSNSSTRTGEEQSLRKTADHEPDNFEANRRLGKWLLEDGKAREALIYLERASRINPSDYEISYAVASAYADIGQYERARTEAQSLLAQQNNSVEQQAELHRLLGDVYEKSG